MSWTCIRNGIYTLQLKYVNEWQICEKQLKQTWRKREVKRERERARQNARTLTLCGIMCHTMSTECLYYKWIDSLVFFFFFILSFFALPFLFLSKLSFGFKVTPIFFFIRCCSFRFNLLISDKVRTEYIYIWAPHSSQVHIPLRWNLTKFIDDDDREWIDRSTDRTDWNNNNDSNKKKEE